MVDFGERLKGLRLKNNMTQANVALLLGITKAMVSAYETGIRLPSYDVLIQMARIFRVTTDYLLGVERAAEIDLSGLSKEESIAIINIIKVMKK